MACPFCFGKGKSLSFGEGFRVRIKQKGRSPGSRSRLGEELQQCPAPSRAAQLLKH